MIQIRSYGSERAEWRMHLLRPAIRAGQDHAEGKAGASAMSSLRNPPAHSKTAAAGLPCGAIVFGDSPIREPVSRLKRRRAIMGVDFPFHSTSDYLLARSAIQTRHAHIEIAAKF